VPVNQPLIAIGLTVIGFVLSYFELRFSDASSFGNVFAHLPAELRSQARARVLRRLARSSARAVSCRRSDA
jgi:hypothetical protein